MITNQTQQPIKTLTETPSGGYWLATAPEKSAPIGMGTFLFEKLKGWFGYNNRATPQAVEYELLQLISKGGANRVFTKIDLQLIETSAQKIGYTKGDSQSEKDHLELHELIQTISQEIEQRPTPQRNYQAIVDKFYKRHQHIQPPTHINTIQVISLIALGALVCLSGAFAVFNFQSQNTPDLPAPPPNPIVPTTEPPPTHTLSEFQAEILNVHPRETDVVTKHETQIFANFNTYDICELGENSNSSEEQDNTSAATTPLPFLFDPNYHFLQEPTPAFKPLTDTFSNVSEEKEDSSSTQEGDVTPAAPAPVPDMEPPRLKFQPATTNYTLPIIGAILAAISGLAMYRSSNGEPNRAPSPPPPSTQSAGPHPLTRSTPKRRQKRHGQNPKARTAERQAGATHRAAAPILGAGSQSAARPAGVTASTPQMPPPAAAIDGAPETADPTLADREKIESKLDDLRPPSPKAPPPPGSVSATVTVSPTIDLLPPPPPLPPPPFSLPPPATAADPSTALTIHFETAASTPLTATALIPSAPPTAGATSVAAASGGIVTTGQIDRKIADETLANGSRTAVADDIPLISFETELATSLRKLMADADVTAIINFDNDPSAQIKGFSGSLRRADGLARPLLSLTGTQLPQTVELLQSTFKRVSDYLDTVFKQLSTVPVEIQKRNAHRLFDLVQLTFHLVDGIKTIKDVYYSRYVPEIPKTKGNPQTTVDRKTVKPRAGLTELQALYESATEKRYAFIEKHKKFALELAKQLSPKNDVNPLAASLDSISHSNDSLAIVPISDITPALAASTVLNYCTKYCPGLLSFEARDAGKRGRKLLRAIFSDSSPQPATDLGEAQQQLSDLTWALMIFAIRRKKQGFGEGAFVLEDPEQKLFKFLRAMPHAAQRPSSHFVGRSEPDKSLTTMVFKSALHYGVDVLNGSMPAQKRHLDFALFDVYNRDPSIKKPQLLFIKPENWSPFLTTASGYDFIMHGYELVEAQKVKLMHNGGDDKEGMQKERVPENVKKAFAELLSLMEKNTMQAEASKKASLWGIAYMADFVATNFPLTAATATVDRSELGAKVQAFRDSIQNFDATELELRTGREVIFTHKWLMQQLEGNTAAAAAAATHANHNS